MADNPADNPAVGLLGFSRGGVLILKRHERKDVPFVGMGNRGLLAANHYQFGDGLIAGAGRGVVTVEGAPASRRVYLFALPDMVCIDDVWADDNGEYRFAQLDTEKRFLLLARDHTGKYEPVSADNVKPEK
ncbi:TPA: hypothetical protein ACLA94_000299 [Neisseria meningitidis]